MEAPPQPQQNSAAPTVPSDGGGPAYPESIDSSPRSRHTDSWDADPPPPQLPQKLRLMCSYGGHIVPRPHDKTLCYIGGETRIIVIDRHTSLADLHHRLSKTLLHNQPFSLKYQLPSEDLDSLISITTEEDIENMVEEYDRLTAAGRALKPGRLRVFLFPKQSSNIEQIIIETASTKSDDWFFNALNGKSNLSAASDQEFSETSSVNCLLGLDDEMAGKASATAAGKDADPQTEGSKNGNGNTGANQDVPSVPDSPMLESTSSFGSTSSSPSVANLPPIRVKVDDNPKVGIEEQFQQISVGVTGNVSVAPPQGPQQKPEEIGGFVHAGVETAALVSGVPVVVSGEYAAANRVISDDESSGHSGYMKVQQIPTQGQVHLQAQQIHQLQVKQTGPFDLASPDSVSSEGSVRQRHAMYQESTVQMQSGNPRVTTDSTTGDQNNTRILMQPQVQESGYVLPGQYDQNHPQLHHRQQLVHSGNHYITANAMPVASYYHIYPHQQQHHHHHHPHQPLLDQQYPIYFMPARQTQAYNMPMQQQGYSELAPTAPSTRPQTPPTGVISHGGYSQVINAPSSKPEMASGMYRTSAGAAPQIVQMSSSQHQGQYMGFTHIHQPSRSVAPSSVPNTAYEFADPAHGQMFYTQAFPPQLAAQYQMLTSAPAAVLPDGSSAQLPVDNLKQPIRALPQ